MRLFLTCLLALPPLLFPDQSEMLRRYQLAALCHHENLRLKVPNAASPQKWLQSCILALIHEDTEGARLRLIDSSRGREIPLDSAALSQGLQQITHQTVNLRTLDLSSLTLDPRKRSLTLSWQGCSYRFDLPRGQVERLPASPPSPVGALSPDGRYLAFVRGHNLCLEDRQTGISRQITRDGCMGREYATDISWYATRSLPKGDYPRTVWVTWSPDSRRLIVPLTDWRDTPEMYLFRSTPSQGYRAEVLAYRRPTAGEDRVPLVSFRVYDIPSAHFLPSTFGPTPLLLGPWHFWTPDSQTIVSSVYTRGWKEHTLTLTDPVTGEEHLLARDQEKTYVDTDLKYFHLLEKTRELIYSSEQDGHNHLYLWDTRTGTVKNRITQGDFVVRKVHYVDAQRRLVAFSASGMQPGRDPYLRALYVVGLDGRGLRCLTPEPADHLISFSPDGSRFTDSMSRVDLPTVLSLHRSRNGALLSVLERADTRYLDSLGYRPPTPFILPGPKGFDVHGLITLPFDFDPGRSYPVLDGTYTGPHTIRSPKTFSRAVINYEGDLSLAQLGFVVVTIDAKGTAFRSKPFHEASYQNLGVGVDEHVRILRELAQTRPWMDLDRVGIYGSSVGGHDTVRGLLKHPGFYRAGVAGAGSHDYRVSKAWWPEMYLGYPANPGLYDAQSNFPLARNLKGKLLLVHGNIDENVNPATTLRLCDELVKANRDFELLLLPEAHHGAMWSSPYFFRRRWDFFVRHLLGQEPPAGFCLEDR